MADKKDPKKQPSPIPEKLPPASSDHEENLIRDDSGEEGTYSGQQQTGLQETSGEADQRKKTPKTGTGGNPPDSEDAKSRYGA